MTRLRRGHLATRGETTGTILKSLQNNTVEDNVAGQTAGTITNSTRI